MKITVQTEKSVRATPDFASLHLGYKLGKLTYVSIKTFQIVAVSYCE
jgi:hypothetical protein